MTKLDLSPSGEEELVAQFVHLISAAISNIHATSKLFSFLEQLITHIPWLTQSTKSLLARSVLSQHL